MQCLCLPGEKRCDDKAVLLEFAVYHHQIFPRFDLPDRKQLTSIPGQNLCRMGDGFQNLQP